MDSDEENESQTWRGIPGIILLVNCFDNNSAGTSTSQIAHNACRRLVKEYLRSTSSGLIAICLYGVENSSTSAFAIQNVVEIFPLIVPSLDEFKKLQDEKISLYQPAKELKLSEVLWHCSKMFANCKKQLSTRTVIMLTRLDEPPIESDRDPALERVSDLVDSNIDLKIINIAQSDYSPHTFYKHLLIQAENTNALPLPLWDPKEIEVVLQSQSHRHLAVARLSLEIGNNLFIGVGVYNLLKSVKSFKQFDLEKGTNNVLTGVTKTMKVCNDITTMDDENSEPKQVPLMKSELLHFVEYGGQKIEFTDIEKKNMNNPFGPPGMKLLGFKPSHIICKEKHFLKKCYFLFPNEGIVEGSTTAFKALHKSCTVMHVVAICVLRTRVNARSQIVALSPCDHPLGMDVDIGFDVIQLPYIENVRDLPAAEFSDEQQISEAQKTVMKEILGRIQFDFKPDMFENPDIQSRYRAFEAIALEEEDLEPFIDTTKPSSSKFETIQGDLFDEIFGPLGASAPKRSAGSEAGISNKRSKLSVDNEEQLREHVRNRTVHKYTVPDLKEILKKHKVTLTGLKKDKLVELVYEYYKE